MIFFLFFDIWEGIDIVDIVLGADVTFNCILCFTGRLKEFSDSELPNSTVMRVI